MAVARNRGPVAVPVSHVQPLPGLWGQGWEWRLPLHVEILTFLISQRDHFPMPQGLLAFLLISTRSKAELVCTLSCMLQQRESSRRLLGA